VTNTLTWPTLTYPCEDELAFTFLPCVYQCVRGCVLPGRLRLTMHAYALGLSWIFLSQQPNFDTDSRGRAMRCGLIP